MKKNLIIVGRPREDRENMTSTLVRECHKAGICYHRIDGTPFPYGIEMPFNYDSNPMVVFVSSKKRFKGVLLECQNRHLTLIVASTDIKAADIPKDLKAPVILAPNLALLIMALFDVMPRFAKLATSIGAKALVAEGHQASKTSPPGTAQKIAGFFGNPPDSVGSIRNDTIASAVLGIDEGDLSAFGAHFIRVSGLGVDVRITFKTIGRRVYFLGLKHLIETIETRFPNGLGNELLSADWLVFGQVE